MFYISIIERVVVILGLLMLTSEQLTERSLRDSHILMLNSLVLGSHSLFGFATKFNLPFLLSGVGIIAIQIMLIDSLYQIHRKQKKQARKISEEIDLKKQSLQWAIENRNSSIFIVSKYGNYARFIVSIGVRIYVSTRVFSQFQATTILLYSPLSGKLFSDNEKKIFQEEINHSPLCKYLPDEEKPRKAIDLDKDLFVSFSRKEFHYSYKLPLCERKNLFREMVADGELSHALHVLAGVDNLGEILDEDTRNMYIDFCSIKKPDSDNIESFLDKISDAQTVS